MPVVTEKNAAVIIDEAIRYALAQVGKPYVWGGTGPRGYDCSGLIYMAYKHAGKNIPRTTGTQIGYGKPVKKQDLVPGDLVFPNPGHVVMYIGAGKVVEAPRTGKNILVTTLPNVWQARRMVGDVPESAFRNVSWYDPRDWDDYLKDGAGTVKDGLDSVTPDWTDLGDIKNAFEAFGKVAAWLINPHNWFRIFLFLAGAAVIYMALMQAARSQLSSAVGLAKKAQSVASTAKGA